jgi:putative Mn2+ efflux pump MntP
MRSLFFIINNILLGVGLAMDAFSVSIVDGLNNPGMRRRKQIIIAGTFAFYQFIMPVIGWILVTAAVRYFREFQPFVPWIALILLLWIGISMLIGGIKDIRNGSAGKDREEKNPSKDLGFKMLMVQGIATSIDALSVGFTLATFSTCSAVMASLIIAVVTFFICMTGLLFGRKFGERIGEKASIPGGLILIGIGIEIFISGVL